MGKHRIAIIEDEIELLELLGSLCKDLGFESFEYRTYEDFIFRYPTILPNLIITDRNLPGINGNELIKTIREIDNKIPIIMISGSNAPENVVNALNLGADDFISKPFHPDILVAKINKILGQTKIESELLINSNSKVIQKDNKEVFLTNLEFKIFERLHLKINDFVPRETLMEKDNSRSLDVHINKLRKKIAEIDYSIETVRSSGYRLKKAA
jgi:DNA-binding response OmpR family regulator